MNNPTTRRFPSRFGALLSTAIALTLGLGLACDLGGEDGPCDVMCNEGPFGGVDEISEEDSLTCTCQKKTPSQQACEVYCEAAGGSADNAELSGKSCTCTGLD